MYDSLRLNFPYIINSNILDAMVQPVVENGLQATPPLSSTSGALYVIGAAPTGEWAGKENCLAQYLNGTWAFYVPFEGMTIWNKTTKSRWYYTGTQWGETKDEQHAKRTDNPHGVTAVQVGAETPSGAQNKANIVQNNLTAHINTGMHKWSTITDKPNNIHDYGILDAYTKTETDSYLDWSKTQIGTEQGELGVEIKGRTLVNLLGKDGNFEVDSNSDGIADGWIRAGTGTTLTVETSGADTGNKIQRVFVPTSGAVGVVRNISLVSGKYYIAIARLRSDSTTAGTGAQLRIRSGGSTYATISPIIYGGVWTTAYCKRLSDGTEDLVACFSPGTLTNVTSDFDAVRLYEITQAEYNAIDSMTADQVAAKYPYVDSVQSKKDILVAQIGKTLIPAFNSGEWVLHANAVVNSAYSMTLNSNATSTQSSTVDINVSPNKQYTVSVATAKRLVVAPFNSDGVTFGSNLVAINDITVNTSTTFTTPSTCNKVRLHLGNNATVGTFVFTNPQLELGSTATAFEAQVKSYAHTPIQIAQDESVWLTPNASVYKEVWKKNVVLDGSLGWNLSVDLTGCKRLRTVNPFVNSIYHLGFIPVKCNGNIMLSTDTAATTIDSAYLQASTGYCYINVPDTDSGWTDAMTPTTAEMSAYFYGWKMCDASGSAYVSDTKYWKKLTDGTGITSTIPTATYTGYTPYTLHYKLATPVYHINYYNHDPTKPIMSAGSVVNIPQGVTQVEQRSGVSFRELKVPYLSTNYYLNRVGQAASSICNYRVKTFLINPTGFTVAGSGPYGLEALTCLPANYNSSADFSVTYEQLDKYLYTIDTLSVDNPVPTRQRNFSLDSTEQKIAYFKINNVDLVGATGVKTPSTLSDYGILDVYTKDVVDTKFKETTFPVAMRRLSDVAQYINAATPVTGTIKITMPLMSGNNSFVDMKIVGFNYRYSGAGLKESWELRIGSSIGTTGTIFSASNAILTPSAPFSSVRFGTDGTNLCILLGTTSTVWSYPAININEYFITSSTGYTNVPNNFSISLITSESGITIYDTPTIKTLATLESPVFTNISTSKAQIGTLTSGYFYNTDYTVGNKNVLQIRQQIASGSSYSAYLGVDRDTGNVFLSNDTSTTQHLYITPAGKIGFNGSVGINKAASAALDVLGTIVSNSPSATSQAMLRSINDAGKRLDLCSIGSTYTAYHSLKPNCTSIYTNTELGIEVDASAPITFWAGFAERMRIAPAGNVSIGTSSPVTLAKLTLKEDSSQVYALALQNRENTATWVQYVDVSTVGDGAFGILQTGLSFAPFCIDKTGNVGLSNASPKATLHGTGSTILGIGSLNTGTAAIGNSQMCPFLDETNSWLQFICRTSAGTLKTIRINYNTGVITVA